MSGILDAAFLDRTRRFCSAMEPERRQLYVRALADSRLRSIGDGQFRDDLAFDWASPLRMNGLTAICSSAGCPAIGGAGAPGHAAQDDGLPTIRLTRIFGTVAKTSRLSVFSNVARYEYVPRLNAHCRGGWSRENPRPAP
jgi:hypothetical protein